jgi:hypothetical protein
MGKSKSIYLIGALKNREIVHIGNRLRRGGFDVFDDWQTPGPEADSFLLEYYKVRGFSYKDALNSYGARHVFEFDKYHIDRCDIGVMIMPCGKSGHLELGYMLGQGKPGYILFDEEPERFDCMYSFSTNIFFDVEDLVKELKK